MSSVDKVLDSVWRIGLKGENVLDFEKARAAVAELIAAADRIATHAPRTSRQIEADWDRFRKALARCKGDDNER